MIKNVLENDMNFRFKCQEIGLDWTNFNIYKDVIVVSSFKKGIYVLFDKYYNIIATHKENDSNMNLTKEHIAELYCEYNTVNEKKERCFSYPFQKLSLRQIIELSNRIRFIGENVLVNGDIIIGDNNKNYIGLLSYIKFLSEEIEQYFKNSFKMKMMGFDYPDVYSYVRSLMNNINECVENFILNNNRPFPINILKYLGQDPKNVDKYSHILYKIINLLMREKGFDHYKEIEPTRNSVKDLSTLSLNLLTILELSDEELNKKLDYLIKTVTAETVNLEKWIEDKISQENSLILKKNIYKN